MGWTKVGELTKKNDKVVFTPLEQKKDTEKKDEPKEDKKEDK